MIRWISQQTVDFVCYFGIGYFSQDSLEYRDLVVQSAFIFGKKLTFSLNIVSHIKIFLVIRLWILYLIWTCRSPTERKKEAAKKQDKLLETFVLRQEEEGTFLV